MSRCSLAVVLASLCLVPACAGPGTASGKPDLVLRGVDAACFRQNVLNGVLSQGWQLKQSSDVQIVVARASPSPVTAVLLGSGFGPPEERLSFTMVPGTSPRGGRELRVVVDLATVTNPETAMQRTVPARFTAADQAAFEAMGRRAESACAAR